MWRFDGPWKNDIYLAALYGKNNGIVSAERYEARQQTNYNFAPQMFAFGGLRLRARPVRWLSVSGKRHRRFGIQVPRWQGHDLERADRRGLSAATKLALTIGYQVIENTNPPPGMPPLKKVDQLTTVNLQFSF